jgi:hypothetical protein
VKFPESFQVESVPKTDTLAFQKQAAYSSSSEVQANTVVMRRAYDLGSLVFLSKDYGDVRTFYNGIAADDQQVVLLRAAPAASAVAIPAEQNKADNVTGK